MSRQSLSPKRGQSTAALNSYGNVQGEDQPGDRSPRKRRDTETMSKTNVYIRGLPPSCVPADLFAMCQHYGEITSTKAVVDQETKRCKGYGFVAFTSPESADRAMEGINNEGKYQAQMAKEIKPRPEKVGYPDFGIPGEQPFSHVEQDPTNLYIANLPKEFDEESIKNLFTPHGMVISTRVLRFDDGSSRCVGFARMESKDACEYIINNYHGKPLEGYTENLVVKLADSGTRRKQGSSNPQSSVMGDQPGIGHWQPTSPYNSFGEEEQTFYPPNGVTGVTYSPQGSLLPLYQMGGVYQQGAVSSINQPGTPSRSQVSNSGQQVVYSPPQNVDYYNKNQAQSPVFNPPFYPYGYPGQMVPPNQQDPQYYQNFQGPEAANPAPGGGAYMQNPQYVMDNNGQPVPVVYGQNPHQQLMMHNPQVANPQLHPQQQQQMQQPLPNDGAGLEQEVAALNINQDRAPEAQS
ncbi:unnamed protein product [Bursaphelenchus okinawaensis]|uniref:Protein alan shepard n=1 Tax=Bursaphelenchus okinawaensis TaxID=465554 RepID=A0A811KI85_9BILA|nr:unnamed protein product [Bursaphelenchus okinawaensis]CAG9103540.1 unnamed protein product [Bursaphelenchus okinawaensis]